MISYTLDFLELIRGFKAACAGAIINDSPGQFLPYTGKVNQLANRGFIEINFRKGICLGSNKLERIFKAGNFLEVINGYSG